MITLPPIKKKEIPRQYFAALDHLNGGFLINGYQTFNLLSISIIISLNRHLIPPYHICVTDVNVMIMTFMALAIMISTDSTGTEAIVAIMTMAEMH